MGYVAGNKDLQYLLSGYLRRHSAIPRQPRCSDTTESAQKRRRTDRESMAKLDEGSKVEETASVIAGERGGAAKTDFGLSELQDQAKAEMEAQLLFLQGAAFAKGTKLSSEPAR